MPALPVMPVLEPAMRTVPLAWSLSSLLLACVSLAACAPPKPPDGEHRPAPAASQAPRPASTIVQAADAYKDRARSAEQSQLEAADQQRSDIDAATQ